MPKLTLVYFLIRRYPAETLSDIEVRSYVHTVITLLCTDVILLER